VQVHGNLLAIQKLEVEGRAAASLATHSRAKLSPLSIIARTAIACSP
jgi:hypothetical protein